MKRWGVTAIVHAHRPLGNWFYHGSHAVLEYMLWLRGQLINCSHGESTIPHGNVLCGQSKENEEERRFLA